MSYHFIEVSAPHSRLWLKDHQLRFEQPDKTTKTLPLEDIAGIIVTSPDCTIHSSLLSGCGQLAVPLIVLCKRYRPTSVVVPSNRGTDTSLMRACIFAKKGLLDRLWQKTISAKIKNQAHLLCHLEISPSNCKLLEMFSSGRMPGREARAAKLYWTHWAFSSNAFHRRRKDGGLNSVLNYGYAVLATAVTQRLLAVGLDPVLGFGHRSRERCLALAYDVMEPFRILVDQVAWTMRSRLTEIVSEDGVISSKEAKCQIVSAITNPLQLFGLKATGLQLIEETIRSLRRSFLAGDDKLYHPWELTSTKWVGF
jgi:CRISPR-associated protein Cas1